MQFIKEKKNILTKKNWNKTDVQHQSRLVLEIVFKHAFRVWLSLIVTKIWHVSNKTRQVREIYLTTSAGNRSWHPKQDLLTCLLRNYSDKTKKKGVEKWSKISQTKGSAAFTMEKKHQKTANYLLALIIEHYKKVMWKGEFPLEISWTILSNKRNVVF